MTRIRRVAGFFLLIAMISVIVQGAQSDKTNDLYQLDSRNVALTTVTGTGEGVDTPEIVQITNRTQDQYHARMSGNWMLWVENERRGAVVLYLYDMANRSEKRVADISSFRTYPEISGNWIGWVENQSDPSGDSIPVIRAYDIQNDTIIQVTGFPAMPSQTSESLYLKMDAISTLDLSENGIVWHDRRDGNMNIYYYNFSTGQEEPITTSPRDEIDPSISGDRVVFAEQYEMEGYNIFLYNLTSGEQERITGAPAMRRNQAISGDHVVWSEWRDHNYDICCYTISSGNTTWITEDPIHQLWPRISGDVIVWCGFLDEDIYAYDLSTQKTMRITDDTVAQVWADIDGNNIIWHDARTGNYNIYLYSLEPGPGTTPQSNATPQAYTVRINSVPSGADILLDGESRGRTPATVYFDRPATHELELVKKGFRPCLTTLNVSSSMSYVANLEKEAAGPAGGPVTPLMAITVDSVPRGANVSVEGKVMGTTLFLWDRIPIREYTLELTLDGYQPNVTTVSSDVPVNISLIPEETDGMDGDGLM
ncbi:PEGA domain-containing protein [Methanoculleus sp.]|uniref:PEGA domain-containing protein n=1 Tax=Methanoculleus sp. TaxID=90427 RepID=UPI002FCB31DE